MLESWFKNIVQASRVVGGDVEVICIMNANTSSDFEGLSDIIENGLGDLVEHLYIFCEPTF